jgi:seryl-tRNA synthetase
MRFPPLLSRADYERMDHIEAFPNLMGSVHTFTGTDRDHAELMRRRAAGEDWSAALTPADVMMTPATCYPLYPTATGVLPDAGRTVDLRSFVFRHEPSLDPTRLMIFRMHEYVRLGTPAQALRHRDDWIARAEQMLRALGLDARPVVANDPFFGRGGRVMAAMQREQALKYELVVPITSSDAPTAVASCNYHMDHFSHTFGIKTPDGQDAHTACVGFGLERVALALFEAHGLDPGRWPRAVCGALAR